MPISQSKPRSVNRLGFFISSSLKLSSHACEKSSFPCFLNPQKPGKARKYNSCEYTENGQDAVQKLYVLLATATADNKMQHL
jgi:hypothetical protein